MLLQTFILHVLTTIVASSTMMTMMNMWVMCLIRRIIAVSSAHKKKNYFRVKQKMYDMSMAKAIVGAVSPTQVVQMGQVFHDKQAELARLFKGKNNQVQKLARNFCLAPKRWKPCSELVTLAGATGSTLGATTPLLLAWAFRNVELVYDFLKQLEPLDMLK